MAGVAPPPRLSTGSHHGERCADNVWAASGARPSSTTHYIPGVISSSRAARRLVGRYAHGVQVCGLRERGERERERERKDRETERARRRLVTQCLLLRSPFPCHFPSILIAYATICTALTATCLCLGCQLARVLHASVVPAACVLVPRVSEREREREVAAEEVITPAAATPGRSIAERKVAGLCVCD